MSKSSKPGILDRLAAGPVIGDGSMVITLEKRGYCRAGAWTPEAVVTYPEAVKQLLREYLRAGADVLQTPCFYASDSFLKASTADGEEFQFTVSKTVHRSLGVKENPYRKNAQLPNIFAIVFI